MNNNNARVRLFGHLIATLSFMPHAGQETQIFENAEQCIRVPRVTLRVILIARY